jgi:hypothetical protein
MPFSLASTSAFTAVDRSARRLSASPSEISVESRVVRCELTAQMRSRAPSPVSWSTTVRCRLSYWRVRQAPRVPHPHHRPGSAPRGQR